MSSFLCADDLALSGAFVFHQDSASPSKYAHAHVPSESLTYLTPVLLSLWARQPETWALCYPDFSDKSLQRRRLIRLERIIAKALDVETDSRFHICQCILQTVAFSDNHAFQPDWISNISVRMLSRLLF